MIAVVISKQQRSYIESIALARSNNKPPEWSNKKLDTFSRLELDCLGMRGEFAAAQYLGAPIDTHIYKLGDDGSDLTFHNHTVSVKYNHKYLGHLIVEARPHDDLQNGTIHNLRSDIIILTHGKCLPPKHCFCRDPGPLIVIIAGWLSKHDFLSKMHIVNWGIGTKYVCKPHQLNPIHTIWNI